MCDIAAMPSYEPPDTPAEDNELFLPADEMPRRQRARRPSVIGRSVTGFLWLGFLAGGAAAGYLLVVAPLREERAWLREQLRQENLRAAQASEQLLALKEHGPSAAAADSQAPKAAAPGEERVTRERAAWSDALVERIHNDARFAAASDAGLLKVARAETYADLWLLPGALGLEGQPVAAVAEGLAAALGALGKVKRPETLEATAIGIWHLASLAQLPQASMRRHPRQSGHRDASARRHQHSKSMQVAYETATADKTAIARMLGQRVMSHGLMNLRVSLGETTRWPMWALPPVRGRDEQETWLLRLELEPRAR